MWLFWGREENGILDVVVETNWRNYWRRRRRIIGQNDDMNCGWAQRTVEPKWCQGHLFLCCLFRADLLERVVYAHHLRFFSSYSRFLSTLLYSTNRYYFCQGCQQPTWLTLAVSSQSSTFLTYGQYSSAFYFSSSE